MKSILSLFLSAVVLVACPAVASAETVVFLDDGVLYGVSGSSVLKSDLSTGERTITFLDGSELTWQSWQSDRQSQSADQNFPAGVQWIGVKVDVREFLKPEGSKLDPFADASIQAACSSESNALVAAIQGVQAACSGDNDESDECISAMNFYDSAESAYNRCIRRNFENIK